MNHARWNMERDKKLKYKNDITFYTIDWLLSCMHGLEIILKLLSWYGRTTWCKLRYSISIPCYSPEFVGRGERRK